MTPVAGLVLAAGESRRMGSDKALLEYHGRTFLEAILENLREAGVARRTVVLGHHADEIRTAARLEDASAVYNPDYRLGQTSSLQAGLREIHAGTAAAVLLCLIDHPAVDARIMAKLIEAFRQTDAPVVIPVFEGARGHPVLIGRPLFGELLALKPREGANTVIRKYRDATCFLNVSDRSILLDIDNPQDYQALREAGG